MLAQFCITMGLLISTHLTFANNDKSVNTESPTEEDVQLEGADLGICFKLIKMMNDNFQSGNVLFMKIFDTLDLLQHLC